MERIKVKTKMEETTMDKSNREKTPVLALLKIKT
jgi:hypothetical protein